ncbi:APC family permease [Deminuibacter soli]|uniref:Amino acid permease n=1 Tax=Deminuibacter soli TaxID=2291815 RepID=A0A3E1NFJ4_9BACT|nr:amino acid permease [Deminuibacter soli]RFM26740.1 amino acid permease [Deminuibacter soli]
MKQKQQLSLFDLTMIVVGLVIGMGIFRTAATSAKEALNPTIFFSAWVAGGLIALCGALTYAEIGSRYPITGGYYRIFSYAYHPSIAFSINCIILISNAASLSGVALIGSGYISQVVFSEPVTDVTKAAIAIAAIIVFYGVNLLGLKMSARTQNVLMLIKIGMILLLIVPLFIPSMHHAAATPAVTQHAGFQQWIRSFGAALVAVSFTYGGYQQTINFGNDVENASRNVPRGIFMGIAIIIGLYLLINISYYTVLGFEELKQQNEIARVMASRMFGVTGGNIFSGMLFLSVLAYVNVLLLSNPRVMFAMSEDGVLPEMFARKSSKRDVLVVSLTAFSAICIVILIFAKTFDEILSFTIFLDCFGMATSAGAIFMLRKRTKHLNQTGIYTMRLYPLLPIIFILAYAFLAVSIVRDKPQTAGIGLLVLMCFMLIYFITRRFTQKKAEQ